MLIVLDVPLTMLAKPPPGPCALSPTSDHTGRCGDDMSTLLWARASMPTQAKEHEDKTEPKHVGGKGESRTKA